MKMRFHAQAILSAVLAGLCILGDVAAGDEAGDAAASAPRRPVRMLFVTQSAGFKHGSVTRKAQQLSPAERAMTELGVASGLFRVDSTQDVAADFTRENLDAHEIVMFYTSGDLPIEKETLDYFLGDWLKQPGHGFVGAHSATDSYKDYEPYWEMIGGTFVEHPWGSNSTVTITIHDPEHPACRPWGKEFTITDEIYRHAHWQPQKVRVLMSLNMGKTALKRPYHVPIAWCKEFGKGRVFYMSLGHREDVWTNPKFMASMLGGVNWILGREDGDATPNPEVSNEEERLARAAVAGSK